MIYGLDPDGVKQTWDPMPEEYWPKAEVARVFVGICWGVRDLRGVSTCLAGEAGLTGCVAAINRYRRADGEVDGIHGKEVAGRLRERVEDEMPVYEFLKARKLVV